MIMMMPRRYDSKLHIVRLQFGVQVFQLWVEAEPILVSPEQHQSKNSLSLKHFVIGVVGERRDSFKFALCEHI